MADIANKYPENITGKYYVDNQCIDCDLCRETAPSNFTRNDDISGSAMTRMPMIVARNHAGPKSIPQD